ncbi:TPA: hypothetical protein ACG3R3_001329 [Clostridioides difficile]|uniref:hypothetical protein n=1 Tax=Clostridioides difficile TaxID=1496 RepID=UPI00146A31BE|nr:hypothetical protein [Clostridioides difficile]MCO4288431.1 hypothetical protein [Clostridioides difficile]NMU16465.1 hypothetical protein [Clostridioides difficile]HBF0592827.1 hypothetical protein [Clostridioides difficile]HBH3691520.1 hypothetical protein [Clostridioides difficile]
MIDKDKIYSNIDYIESMTQNGASPNLDKHWHEIVDILSKDLKDTEEFLLNECNEYRIWFISGYFEDISYNFQNEGFIEILKKLEKKYPNSNLKDDIHWAEKAIQKD